MRKGLVPGWITGYSRDWLRPDLIAGVVIWSVVTPQAVAYAQIAGLPAQAGLMAAPGAMIAYALVGTSRQLVVSATTATSAVSAATAARSRTAIRCASPRCQPRWRSPSRSCWSWVVRCGSELIRRPGVQAGDDGVSLRPRPDDLARPAAESPRRPGRQRQLLSPALGPARPSGRDRYDDARRGCGIARRVAARTPPRAADPVDAAGARAGDRRLVAARPRPAWRRRRR